MKTSDLVAHFGNVRLAAEAFGVSVQAVYKWQREGVPPVRQEQAQRLTRGKLKASITAVDEIMGKAAA